MTSAAMDLATELSSDHHQNIGISQSSAVSPVSPLRPAPIPSSSQMLVPGSAVAASNYYSTPPSLLHHHHHHHQQHDSATKGVKLSTHAASGNGLQASSTVKSNEQQHKSADQVMTDQAREILRQAVVSGFAENAAAGGAKASSKGSKGAVRYRECQKNHAAGIGGHAIDGCGEFMPDHGDDDDAALRCAACSCHRNFHRREVEGELYSSCDCKLRKAKPPGYTSQALAFAAAPPLALTAAPNPLAISTGGPTDSDDQDDDPPLHTTTTHHPLSMATRSPGSAIKKRFRTKFTTDQKDQMCAFAEKLGWRIQKHDEGAVQDFCSSVGVKRHVLKVWMHNNKHTMGSKKPPPLELLQPPQPPQQQ